jgi:hypothetical protein
MAKYGSEHVQFVFVYQREPHARQQAFRDVPQPQNLGERCELAHRTCAELALAPGTVWIDGMDDQSRALFGDLPSPAIVVDPFGLVRAKLPWAEPDALAPLLAGLLPELPAEVEARLAPAAPAVRDGDRARIGAQLWKERHGRATSLPTEPPANDTWSELVAAATLAAERPDDARWRACIDRLAASADARVRHWALARLAARCPQDAAAAKALADLRTAQPWLQPAK